MNRTCQLQNRFRRGISVVSRERDVALAMVKSRDAQYVSLTPLLLVATHLLRQIGRAHV